MITIVLDGRPVEVRSMQRGMQQDVAEELACRAVARAREGKRWKAVKNLWRLALVVLLASGCGPALGGSPEIMRHEYPADGVVCYVATGYGTRNYEVSMSCVKTKEKP